MIRKGFLWVGCLLLAGLAAPPSAAKKDEGAAWPEITAAEKDLKAVPQDPGAAAVILLHTRDGKVTTRGKYLVNILQYHWRMKVLSDRGKDYAEIKIPAGKYSRVSDIEARTIKPDGTIVPVASDQIFEKVVQKDRYSKETAFVFNFPAVEPGAILEYRYEREARSLVFIEPWIFSGSEFTLYSRVTQALPVDAHYISLCDKCPNPEPERTDWKEGKMHGRLFTLEMKDIPAHRDEMLMPPPRDADPRFEMVLKGWAYQHWDELGRDDALFIDWDSVARYVDFYYRKTYRLDEALVASTVASWTTGLATADEKLQAIVGHVRRDFRYLESSSIYGRTRSVPDLLKDHTADNEEKAVLLAAALRSTGLEPTLALVAGRHKGPAYRNYYSLTQFSHAIVGVPQAGGALRWIDPTVTYAPFGFLPWFDSGAVALVIKSPGAELITLPEVADPGSRRYTVTVKAQPDGKAAVNAVAEFQGEDAVEMRDDLVPISETERRGYLQRWSDDLRSGAALQSFEIQDLEAIDKPLRISMVLEAPGLVTRAEDVMTVRGCILDCFDSNPISRGERTLPIYVDRGMKREQIVTISAPEGMKGAAPPARASAESAIGSLKFSCRQTPDGSTECTRSFSLPRGRWPAEMGAPLRKMFDQVVTIDRTAVTFRSPEEGAKP